MTYTHTCTADMGYRGEFEPRETAHDRAAVRRRTASCPRLDADGRRTDPTRRDMVYETGRACRLSVLAGPWSTSVTRRRWRAA